MGSKTNPGKFDCYANALPDEPMFVLLARDPYAPYFVEMWAERRKADVLSGARSQADMKMVDEANACAADMRKWREANLDEWRHPVRQPEPKPGESWKHYKGGVYRVLGVGRMEADGAPVVLYRSASLTAAGGYDFFVRPLREWQEKVVNAAGNTVRRFAPMKEAG